jgi:antitoxin VapB
VRLPKEFRFKSGRVYVKKMGNAVILLPYGAPWQSLVDSLSLFSSDFMQEWAQPPAEQSFPKLRQVHAVCAEQVVQHRLRLIGRRSQRVRQQSL